MVEIDELREVMRNTMMYIRKNMRIFSNLAVILMEEMSRGQGGGVSQGGRR